MYPVAQLLAFILGTNPVVSPSGPAVTWPAQRASTAPVLAATEYRLTRVQRSSADLVARTRLVLRLFSPAQPDADRLERWAKRALDTPHKTLQFHPLPNIAPQLVVMVHPWEDDLLVMDIARLRARPDLDYTAAPVVPDPGIGEVAARSIMIDTLAKLEHAGVLPDGYSAASARLGVWREHESRGPDQVAEWVAEYQFTMNRIVDGLELMDAGVKIGIHRDGGVSSIRVTDVDISPVSTSQPLTVTMPQAREAFVAAEQASIPDASISVERERLGMLLRPNQHTAVLTPSVVFNYTLRFESPGGAAVSRQKIAMVSLLTSTYTQVYPVPSTTEPHDATTAHAHRHVDRRRLSTRR